MANLNNKAKSYDELPLYRRMIDLSIYLHECIVNIHKDYKITTGYRIFEYIDNALINIMLAYKTDDLKWKIEVIRTLRTDVYSANLLCKELFAMHLLSSHQAATISRYYGDVLTQIGGWEKKTKVNYIASKSSNNE